MKKLLEGVHTWSAFSKEKQVDFNGYHLRGEHESLLIDPPAIGMAEEQAIRALGKPTTVLITNKDHRRDAARARELFGAQVRVHILDLPLLGLEAEPFLDGDTFLDGALRVIHLADQKSPGESALYWKGKKLLILGDALWGKPAGLVTMLPDDKYADPERARAGLRRLAGLEVETLLVGDGAPILSDAGAVLSSFLGEL